MQIFEAIELKEFPYMITKEILEFETVREILTIENENKAYILMDHEFKRIWTYNGVKSSFKLQIYCRLLAKMVRTQLRLFYRVYPLNMYNRTDKRFEEILDKHLIKGQAKPIIKDDFTQHKYGAEVRPDISIIHNVNVNKAFEYISEIPQPENFIRKFVIVGGNVYVDEEISISFINEEKTIKKPLKLGRLNRGFTFFDDNYSTRLIIHDRRVEGIELYGHKEDNPKAKFLGFKIPIFSEEKFSRKGSIDSLINAFQIPEEFPEESKND